MRASIILLILLFVSFSCKRIEKELPTLVEKDSFENTLDEKALNESSVFSDDIGRDTLKKIDLPIGSELLNSYEFSEKFGSDDEDLNGKDSLEVSLLHKIIEQNRSYLIRTCGEEDYLKAAMEYDFFYKLVARDSVYDNKNIKIIGKIVHKQNALILCSLVHNTLPIYSSIFLVSLDSTEKIKDVLVLFDEQVDYLSQTNELFYIDTNLLITKKYFSGFEGVTFFNGEHFTILNAEGYFIRYYDTNGLYQNKREQGLVKNNTREGLWKIKNNISPDDKLGLYTYLEANYKDGMPEGKWSYFVLNHEKDFESQSDITIPAKGPLLFTEIYKKGEMVKREFVDVKN